METAFPILDLKHDPARAFLDATLAESRARSPALLFTGPEGVGKEYEAVNFARRICCTNDPVCSLGGDMCDSCGSAIALGKSNSGISKLLVQTKKTSSRKTTSIIGVIFNSSESSCWA